MKTTTSLLAAIFVVTGVAIWTPPAGACQPVPLMWSVDAPEQTTVPSNGALPLIFSGPEGLSRPDNQEFVSIEVTDAAGAMVEGDVRAYQLPTDSSAGPFGDPKQNWVVAWTPTRGWSQGKTYSLERVVQETHRYEPPQEFDYEFEVVSAMEQASPPTILSHVVDVRDISDEQTCCTIDGCETDCPPTDECTQCWTSKYSTVVRLSTEFEAFESDRPDQYLYGVEDGQFFRSVDKDASTSVVRDLEFEAPEHCITPVLLRLSDGQMVESDEICATDLPDHTPKTARTSEPEICSGEQSRSDGDTSSGGPHPEGGCSQAAEGDPIPPPSTLLFCLFGFWFSRRLL